MAEKKSRRIRFKMHGSMTARDARIEDAETGEMIQGVRLASFRVEGPDGLSILTLEIECHEAFGGIVDVDTMHGRSSP